MKKLWGYFAIWTVIIVLCASGCCWDWERDGNGRVRSQERSGDNFNAIVLEGVGDVYVHSSLVYKVVVTTDSNIQEFITTRVRNNTLHIDEKGHRGFNATKLTIDVYMPELERIRLSGAGNIKVLDGKTTDLDIILSGTGNIDTVNYEVKNVDVILSGCGDVKIWATNTLTGKLSGVGDIKYKGSPTVNVNSSGIGRIKSL